MTNLMDKYPWWDYTNFLKMIKDWCEQSAPLYEKEGHLVSSRDTANKLRFVVMLINRIEAHDYLRENKVFSCRNHVCDIGEFEPFLYDYKSDDRQKEDLKLLFDYINKILPHVWD